MLKTIKTLIYTTVFLALVLVFINVGTEDGGLLNGNLRQEETIILIKEDQVIVNNSEVNLTALDDILANSKEPIEITTDNARLITYRKIVNRLDELNLSYFEKSE